MSLADSSPTQVGRLRSIAHPVRLEMLSLLTGATLSAAEVSRELGLTQANASYHLRRLLAAGLLVIDGEEKVNGGTAKKYRHLWDAPQETEGPATEIDRLAEVRAMAEMIPRRFQRRRGQQPASTSPGRESGRSGAREPTFFSDIDTWVEPAVWEEAMVLARRASSLLHAGARPPRTEGTLRATMSIAAFRMEEGR